MPESERLNNSSSVPRRPGLSLLQILVLAGCVVGLLIAVDFNQRLQRIRRTEVENARLRTEVAQLEAEQFALQTQVAYATTDAAVIAWAHAEGKLAQPGEVLVVPLLPPSPTPLPPQPTPTPLPPATWELWWNLFFETAYSPTP